jgi:hypothetical protein
MSKDQVEGTRYSGEIERLDEQASVADLPSAAAAHEPAKLLLLFPSSPLGLLLESAEGSEISLSIDDSFHGVHTESADQLVLQICDAHVEPQPFHVRASEVGAEAGPFETAPELALLADVAETCQPQVEPLWAEPIQEPADGLRTPDRHDGDALGVEIATTACRERFERSLIADPFDQHDGLLLVHVTYLRCESGCVTSP